jgi:hypothetical protein
MAAKVVTPFQSNEDDENPEDFLWLFFRQMGTSTDDVKKTQFPYYLQADSVADEWFLNLQDDENKTWNSIEAVFMVRWPRKKQAKKTDKEYEDEILGRKLKMEDLGKKEKVAGQDVYTHVAWADKMATTVKGAKLEQTSTHIRQVRRELPDILREKVGTGQANWTTFLQAVRDVDVDHIRDIMELWNKEMERKRAVDQCLRILETVSRSPTAPLQQQLSTVNISSQSPRPATAVMGDPFGSTGGGQGNLKYTTNTSVNPSPRSTPSGFNTKPELMQEQKTELQALLNKFPHHPDTQAGRQAHQAQQADMDTNLRIQHQGDRENPVPSQAKNGPCKLW